MRTILSSMALQSYDASVHHGLRPSCAGVAGVSVKDAVLAATLAQYTSGTCVEDTTCIPLKPTPIWWRRAFRLLVVSRCIDTAAANFLHSL